MKNVSDIKNDLSEIGRNLLKLILSHIETTSFEPGNPQTYLGYQECCVALNVAPADEDVPWGRLLQMHGLTDLNDWTMRHDFPKITGLIVNQGGDRKYWPGGDYFKSNSRSDMDGVWWEEQARNSKEFDWTPYL